MLLPKHYATRWLTRTGLLVMLGLLFLTWHFYLERAAYYDLAYHLFTYLRTNELFIQNRRFVAIVTQLPTLLAVRAGWPIDQLLRFYSVVFGIYYITIYLLITKWFKNEQVALVVPMLFVLLASRSFYWAQSEFPQALVVLLLFYAGVSRQAPLQRRFSTLALAALIPVFIFGHPLSIFPFLFVWAYDWLLNRRWRDWPYYGLLVVGLVMYQYRASLIEPGSYEATNNTFGPNARLYFPHYLSLDSFHVFWGLCRSTYIALPILLALLTAYYLRQRTWPGLLRLALVWGSVSVYVLLVNISKPDYTEPTYLDNVFLPLGIFIGVPTALELLPALERYWGQRGPLLVAGLVGLVLALRLALVYQAHEPYTAYQQWLGRVLTYSKQFPERRYLVADSNIDPTRLRAGWPWWASAYETLLLSARPSPDSARVVFITYELNRFIGATKAPGMFLGAFDNFPSRELNPTYFHLGNEGASYRLLNTAPPADTAALRTYIAARRETKIELVSFPTALKADSWRTVRVRISVPTSGQPLHSGLQTTYPTLLRSRLYDATNWPVPDEAMQVPLELDVWQPWQQDIPLRCPTKAGRYILEVSLISKDYRDWPVHLRLPVEVD